MRIATWNVNSLKARLEKVTWWLERARPDVLLMQETKLADDDVPADVFRAAGYELAHHGEGRWNGVAVASRVGMSDVVANFGQPLRPRRRPTGPTTSRWPRRGCSRRSAAGCASWRSTRPTAAWS